MNIELHIERLVLEGIDLTPGRADTLRRTLHTELVRLLQEQGLPTGIKMAVPRLQAPAINVPHAVAPAELGRRVARSVHGGLSR